MTKRPSKDEAAAINAAKLVKEKLFTLTNELPPAHALSVLNAVGIYCMTQRLRIIKRMEGEP